MCQGVALRRHRQPFQGSALVGVAKARYMCHTGEATIDNPFWKFGEGLEDR